MDFTTPLRPPVANDDRLVTPSMSGTLELMTPGIQALPGRPRFFVHGDAGALFGVEHHVARERAPSHLPPLTADDPPYLRLAENFIEPAVSGIGSETTAEVQPLLVTAGGGIAFTVDLWGRRFRIKPSLEYMREEIDFTGSDCGLNYGSAHDSLMVVLCDGSVHSVRFSIPPTTFFRLCVINDNLPTGFPE